MPELIDSDLRWCLKRIPPSVLSAMEQAPGGVFVAGGFIRSLVAGEAVSDVDVFLSGPGDLECHDVTGVIDGTASADMAGWHVDDNALTRRVGDVTIRVITGWEFATPDDLLAHFDFTVCRAVLWYEGDRVVSRCDGHFYPDLAARRLVYTRPEKDRSSGGTLLRMCKFIARGYRIPLDSLASLVACVAVDGMGADDGHGRLSESDLRGNIRAILAEVDPAAGRPDGWTDS